MESCCAVCHRPWWAPESSFKYKNGSLKHARGHPDTEGHYVFSEGERGEGTEHLIRWENVAGDPVPFRGMGDPDLQKTLSTAVGGALSYDEATGKFTFRLPVG